MSVDRPTLKILREIGVLKTSSFQDAHLKILQKHFSISLDSIVEKVVTIFAHFFGILSAPLALRYLQCEPLRKRYLEKIECWKQLYTAFKNGMSFREISKLSYMQNYLKKLSAFNPTTVEEVIQREVFECFNAIPMIVEVASFKSRYITPQQLSSLEEKTIRVARRLYDYLDKKNTTLTPQQMEELEQFCNKGWGILRQGYVTWRDLICRWNGSSLDALFQRFYFPLVQSQEKLPENPSLGFREYSVWLSIHAFEERISLKLPKSLYDLLFHELLSNELLRQELFIHPRIQDNHLCPTQHGSLKFNEILLCIHQFRSIYTRKSDESRFLEWFYFADGESRLSFFMIMTSQKEDRFTTSLNLMIQLQKIKVEHSLKVFLFLFFHKDPEPFVHFILNMVRKICIKNLTPFVLWLMNYPENYRSFETLFLILHKEIQKKFPLKESLNTELLFEIGQWIQQSPERVKKIHQFTKLFYSPQLAEIQEDLLYAALKRFCNEDFTEKEMIIMNLSLSPTDTIEFFAFPLPPLLPLGPETLALASEKAKMFQKKYGFSEAETARLMLKFAQTSTVHQIEIYRNLIEGIENFLKSFLPKDIAFHLYYDFPIPREELKAVVQRLHSDRYVMMFYVRNPPISIPALQMICKKNESFIKKSKPETIVRKFMHIIDDAICPLYFENWRQFLDIAGVDDDGYFILHEQASLNHNMLCLVNPDLPQGQIMLCRWTAGSSFPAFEMVLLDPFHRNAKACSFIFPYTSTKLREDRSIRRVLSKISPIIADERNFNLDLPEAENSILKFIQDIKLSFRFYHLDLMESNPRKPEYSFSNEITLDNRLSENLLSKIPILVQKIREKKEISLGAISAQLLQYSLFWSFDPSQRNEILFKTQKAEIRWCYGAMVDHEKLENILEIQLLILLKLHNS